MPRFILFLPTIFIGIALAIWLVIPKHDKPTPDLLVEAEIVLDHAPPKLPPYADTLGRIEDRRRELALRVGRESEREAALADARRLLQNSLSRDLPSYWLGTPWDFNGISETPGEGQIACGYFVSTLLRDAGFRVERIRLAQQASGNIIRSLTSRKNTSRLVGKSFEEFLAALETAGPGIYVIGLDNHVGIIAKTSRSAAFIHSDGGPNQCVVVEPVEKSRTLQRSNWREFANLCADDDLLEKWLSGGEFPTYRS